MDDVFARACFGIWVSPEHIWRFCRLETLSPDAHYLSCDYGFCNLLRPSLAGVVFLMLDAPKSWKKQPGTTIVYDGECPFCSSYTRLVRLRDAIGPITLINARERPDIVADAAELGLNVNEGMLVAHQFRIYAGDEAMTFLSAFSSRSGILNQIMSWVFSNPRRSRALYPMLRWGRNLTLSMLGRSQIPPKIAE